MHLSESLSESGLGLTKKPSYSSIKGPGQIFSPKLVQHQDVNWSDKDGSLPLKHDMIYEGNQEMNFNPRKGSFALSHQSHNFDEPTRKMRLGDYKPG